MDGRISLFGVEETVRLLMWKYYHEIKLLRKKNILLKFYRIICVCIYIYIIISLFKDKQTIQLLLRKYFHEIKLVEKNIILKFFRNLYYMYICLYTFFFFFLVSKKLYNCFCENILMK